MLLLIVRYADLIFNFTNSLNKDGMITKKELEALIASDEKANIEKTVSTKDNNKFGEAICAFANDFPANNKAGYLLLGISDDNKIAGMRFQEDVLQSLLDFRTDGRIVPPPMIIVEKFVFDAGDVIVAEVHPSFQPPVRYKGKVYIRAGARKSVATEAEERVLSEKRSSFAKTYDSLPGFGSNLSDLSIDIFKINYLPQAVAPEIVEANHRQLEEQLASLKFYDLKENCPTNAGILMFGKNPRFYLPGAYIQYVKFLGNDEGSDFDYEYAFSGDLTTQMRLIEEFIKSQIIKTKAIFSTGGVKEEYIANYPVLAIRELLFNAIIHRDYQSNAPVKFYEFNDRIEITNPGGLYGNARPENFPSVNDYRNPVIAEAAKTLGYVNTFNVGVKRAIIALKNNGNPDPLFIKDQPASFAVIIYKKEI